VAIHTLSSTERSHCRLFAKAARRFGWLGLWSVSQIVTLTALQADDGSFRHRGKVFMDVRGCILIQSEVIRRVARRAVVNIAVNNACDDDVYQTYLRAAYQCEEATAGYRRCG